MACNDNDLSITTSVWRQDPGQHLLITATNFTDKPCTLYRYPYIGYQDRALQSNKESAMLDVALSKEIGSLNVAADARVTYWNRDLGAVEDLLFRSGTR
ncbi:DUF4232 domain-containing protein [Streptomyces xanthophaeus]|uniref:DUF4232 domain-containing protein n=1 Tax=Streptomyces xanthophaeus TaxID=67385 RepID=UPI002647F37D|nr:DUF4232 domain-containing protein [Streptomyces xanthophaeus]WKD34319.1 DUF4232 domain-containing protein [Streptomyces xanthophaeus]